MTSVSHVSDKRTKTMTRPAFVVAVDQYAICPFCHKLKALLNYIGLDHDIGEVNLLTKT